MLDVIHTVLFVVFVIDSVLLVIAVLLQSGRGGGLAGALGGIGAGDSALGVRAASQIEKATGVMAAIFLVVALALAYLAIGDAGPPKGTELKGREGMTGVETSPAKGARQSSPAKGASQSSPAAKAQD